jgi:leader peptidase (prepilin peptidase)/N-methyltransferase
MTSLDFLLQISALLFGAIVGSFLNALSFRFNTGRSIAKGRSRCMSCGHELGPLDLVPVFSYLFLGGRCRYCGTKISIQYPLVEAVAALVSLLVFITTPEPLAYAYAFLFWMTLLFIVVYDIRHTVIPWSVSGFLALLAFGSLFISFDYSALFFYQPAALALLAGPALALPLFLLSLVSRGRWMGWGDAPLELSLGWFLGITSGLTALMLAFWVGAAVGILLMLVKKGLTMKSEIPFAPFLVLGAFIAYFFHVDFFQTLPLLW